jgi:uncharacterized protein YidB (DUF937 family)
MGLLDDVIVAALGAKSGSAPSSPIATALLALLASRGSASGQTSEGSLGGLGGLIDRFRNNGLEDAIKSWIGTGQNQAISPGQLRQALGQETVEDLAQQTGLAHGDLLSQLSNLLPGVVDRLTPNGQLPSESDLLPGPR